MLLTGCDQTRKQIEFTPAPKITLPAELFEPEAEPFRPPLGATQKDVALLLEDFRESLARCNADKETIAQILQSPLSTQ